MNDIILCFDSDLAGLKASMAVVERQMNQGDRSRHNSNWVSMHDEYMQYLEDLTAVGLGMYSLEPETLSVRYDYINWSTDRLANMMLAWQDVRFKCLTFGNRYNVEWVLPIAKKHIDLIEEQMIKRATPKRIEATKHGMEKWLVAKDVIAEVDPFDVYASLIDVVEHKSNNEHVRCKCPFHDSKTGKSDAFSFNHRTGRWKCFAGCGEGSLFDFVMKFNNVDFKTSVEIVAELGHYVKK